MPSKVWSASGGKREIKTSTGLLTIFAAAVIIFGGCYTYAMVFAPQPDYTVNTTNNVSTPAQKLAKETKDWETYTNATEGYSIKYPTGWTLGKDDAANVGVWPTGADNYSLNVTVLSSQLNLADYISGLKTEATKEINNGQPGDTFGTQSQTTIGGQPVIKFVNCTEGASAYKFDWYFVKNGSNIYRIAIVKVVGQGTVIDVNKYIPIAENILATMKFSTPNPTVDWKTYSKSIYGQEISFKYPASWKITNDKLSTSEPGYNLTFSADSTAAQANKIFTLDVWRTSEVAPTSLEQEKNNLTQTAKSGNFQAVFNDLKIGGLNATKISYSGLSSGEKTLRGNPAFSVINSEIFYNFQTWSNDASTQIDQVISTFQFTK